MRLDDIVAYGKHDVDDALRAGVLRTRDVPKELLTVLGRSHSGRISRLVSDVIAHTKLDEKARIVLSLELEEALKAMRAFLYVRVYENPAVHDEFSKCEKMLRDLFNILMEEPKVFARVTGQRANGDKAARGRAVCDFLAGMTDRYAIRLYEELFVPQPWPIRGL